ncbi:hypothetical protein Tco_0447586, partial [Tanacetum coccineum]
MLGRPRKARMKRKYEPKKSKTKLSHHERDIYYGICKSVGHNYKTCTVDDGGKYQPKKSKTKKSATKNAPSQVTDLEANLEQFKIEQAAIKSEAAKQ